MGISIFVFGLPGSGKSAAARHIKSIARQNKLRPRRFRDYTILYRMFRADQKANKEEKRFHSTQYAGYDGFDVLDFNSFDAALQKLQQAIRRRKKPPDDSTELLIIEFSRVDYCKALAFFTALRLQDAHYLFIDADIATCQARIKARVERPQTLDDRYVSDNIFEAYYQRDRRQYIPEVALQLNRQFGVPLNHIQIIHNGSEISVQQFYQAVASRASEILKIRV